MLAGVVILPEGLPSRTGWRVEVRQSRNKVPSFFLYNFPILFYFSLLCFSRPYITFLFCSDVKSFHSLIAFEFAVVLSNMTPYANRSNHSTINIYDLEVKSVTTRKPDIYLSKISESRVGYRGKSVYAPHAQVQTYVPNISSKSLTGLNRGFCTSVFIINSLFYTSYENTYRISIKCLYTISYIPSS